MISRPRFEELRAARIEELALARANGQKVAGCLSGLEPFELIRACGAIPVRLARGGYDAEVRGEKYLRSDACPFCLSTAGNFETDPLHRLVDVVVATSTCDLLRRLPETLHEQFGIPVLQLYRPRTSEPLPHRLAEYERQLRRLADELAALTGTGFDPARYVEAVRDGNRARARLRELDATRLADRPGVSESDILDLTALAGLLEPAAFMDFASTLRPGTLEPSNPLPFRPRLALAGSEIAEQDRRLVELVERRADIVYDMVDTGSGWFAADVEPDPEPFAGLARSGYHTGAGFCRRPNDDAYARLRHGLAERRARGLVLKTLLYCDPWSLEAKRLQEAFRIPLLHLDTDYSTENREQVRTRVEAFLETL